MEDVFQKVNELLPFYLPLFTDRQKEILQLYFYEDLSLAEIAENLSISRNGVFDTIKKGEKALEQYESLLHLYQNYEKRSKLYKELLKLNDLQVNKIVDELNRLEEEEYE